MAAGPTNLIKEPEDDLELFRQLFARDNLGTHQIRYALSAPGFNNGNLEGGFGTPPAVIPATTDEQAYIAEVFRSLSTVINIQAVQVNSLASPLQLVSVQTVRDDFGDPLTSGITYTSFAFEVAPSGVRTVIPAESQITVELELNDDAGLSAEEKRTIKHEIMHALGGRHPDDDPNNPAFTDRDTLMSYRVGGDDPATEFSSWDLTALQEIWGTARGSGVLGQPERIAVDGVTGLVVSNFESGVDQLVLNPNLPGLRSLKLKAVSGSRKALNKKGLASSAPLVYWRDAGELFLNSNGKQKGFGDGGVLAELGALTPLSAGDLSFA